MRESKISYQHFCPVARALEVIGEKWSLLIVRDLLAGPRRFSDLKRSLAAITPRWLTLRLRELEASGIVAREAGAGREVWYSLTASGRDLAPVVRDLVVWGFEHALQPARPSETVHPGRATEAFVSYLNQRGVTLPRPATWLLRFEDEGAYALRFDGERWTRRREEQPDVEADLVLQLPAQRWATLMTSDIEERRLVLREACVSGAPEAIEALASALRREEPAVA